MRYFLKKSTPSKKGLYLQIYQSCYVPGKGADKGNIIFNNLGKITFTSFGYSSLNSSSFPFIL